MKYVLCFIIASGVCVYSEETKVDGNSLDEWIVQLNNGGFRECLEAIRAIGEFGPKAYRATRLLEKIQRDDEFDEFREGAKIALIRIDPKSKNEIPDLIKTVRFSSDERTRLDAIMKLGYIGPPPKKLRRTYLKLYAMKKAVCYESIQRARFQEWAIMPTKLFLIY